MARKRRIQFPGMMAHVFSRGNEKKDIYLTDEDRYRFISYIQSSFSKFDYIIHAYCLMPNHYHLLIESKDGRLGALMQYINGNYARYFNWEHKRCGHLFQDRYKSIVVEKDEYISRLVRYIIMNPVKDGFVDSLYRYEWCSYREYMGKKGFKITYTDWILRMFGKQRAKARNRFRAYLAEENGEDYKALEVSELRDIVLGSEKFVNKVAAYLKKKKIEVSESALRTTTKPPKDIIEATAEKFGVTKQELMSKRGKWNYARRAAIYFVGKYCGCSKSEAAGIFGVHISRVKRISDSIKKERRANLSLDSLMRSVEKSI